MNRHIIPLADQCRLPLLEEAKDFDTCKHLILRAIAQAGTVVGHDMLYELGAAHLRLSIYELVLGELHGHTDNMAKADDLLPRPDLLALAASWTDRIGENREKTKEYCIAFFEAADTRYKDKDGVSRSYFEAMEELREKLVKG